MSSQGIAYSRSGVIQKNSYNELVSVEDDGHTLQLRPIGMQMVNHGEGTLSQQGAAEYYWSIFIKPVQE